MINDRIEISEELLNKHIFGRPLREWMRLRNESFYDDPSKLSETELNALEMMREIGKLRAKVSYYESRIQDLNKFMLSNIEIKENERTE